MFNKVCGLSAIVVVVAILSACTSGDKQMDSFKVSMNQVSPSGVGADLGTVTISSASGGGVEFVPDLHDLMPGEHGFSVHEVPSCDAGSKDGVKVAALAAGGSLDDLPGLTVDDKGFATVPVVAKQLKLADLKGRSLVINSQSDDAQSGNAAKGGGSRVACGIIE
ncbi:superoxide dismutase family protein [Endozoicomonas sp. 4G]|uniref:superoxide dismutase family protein n=1 Tax=Endozoicomonas sp. 4G TaxID=2872754 RepID=UPI00207866DB|nr:superoxide dismutase family protein [Endozoicomonas sp. 4G]